MNVFVLITLHFILFTTSFTYEKYRTAIKTLHLEIPVIPKGEFEPDSDSHCEFEPYSAYMLSINSHSMNQEYLIFGTRKLNVSQCSDSYISLCILLGKKLKCAFIMLGFCGIISMAGSTLCSMLFTLPP